MSTKKAARDEKHEATTAPATNVRAASIDELIPDPANVRRHGERNIAATDASLARFGPARSIVIDEKGIVRAGNRTLESARAAGVTDVLIVDPEPGQLVAVRRRDWSPSEAVAYAIADNRTAELAEWDEAGLADQLRALQSEDFDLGSVGYSDAEVDGLLERLGSDLATPDRGPTPEDNLDTYLDRTVKRITLFFGVEEYDRVIERLDAAGERLDAADYTATVLKLLDEHENAAR